MTITYTITRRDLLAFRLYHLRHSPSNWFCFAALGFLFFQRAGDVALVPRIVATVIFLLLMLPILLALYVAIQWLGLWLRKPSNLSPPTVTASDTGLQIKTATSCQDHQWVGITKLCRTRRHLFIYLTPRIACIVPRRAFQDANAWESFNDLCRRKTALQIQQAPPGPDLSAGEPKP